MAYLSAGVYVKEVDNSAIVPTVSNSVAFFSGNFTKGVIEQPFVITNKDELEYYFGKPTNENYNEWYQCFKFFDYSNQLVVSRAFTEGNPLISATVSTIGAVTGGSAEFDVVSIDGLYIGTKFNFNGYTDVYEVQNITYSSQNNTYKVFLVNSTEAGEIPASTFLVIHGAHQNSGADAYRDYVSTDNLGLIKEDFAQDYALYKNYNDFEVKKDANSIAFNTDVKLKFIARTAGSVNDDVEVAICNSYDFIDYDDYDTGLPTGPSKAQAFEGVPLAGFFEYAPKEKEVGIVIRQGSITESFICSFDETSVDGNNKSLYIENVINDNSNIVFIVENETLGMVELQDPYQRDYLVVNTYVNSYLYKNSQDIDGLGALPLFGGEAPKVAIGDIKNAYDEVLDKEQFEIDVVIGNEEDLGAGAVELANSRQDCIAMVGARYTDVVGKKSAEAVTNLVAYLNSNDAPTRTMFGAFFGNYHRIYDNFAKKYRWISVAGDMAGLRSNTNSNQASWWASAGLRRGVVRNIDKLAFSPSLPQRDTLYKTNINPIVAFPGEGNLCWGQKTLLNYSSSFDRINVRGLFNTIERAMAKASRSTVFEFNDPFTRNAILAMFNPYLSTVKAGRGITDFLVVCDETNNTPDVISRNELRVDIYIKPNYASEFIILTFNNVGTRSFSSVVGA